MKKIHIHFGIHRTGTTSIHQNLLRNKDVLKKLGYIYPELGVSHRHVKIAWELLSKKIQPKEFIELINNEFLDEDATLILSSEDFSQLKKANWLSLLASEFDVSGSVYLRRQDKWLESWYNQHIKWPWDKRFSSTTPDSFLNHMGEFYWIEYEWLLDRLVKYIPRDKLYIQVMERSVVEDTTLDFMRSVGINSELLNIKEPVNVSLTKCQLDIVRLIDLIDLNQKYRPKLIKAVTELNIPEGNASRVIFTSDQRRKIIKKFEGSNEKVAEKYFNRKHLFLEPVSFEEPDFLPLDVIYSKYIPDLIKNLSKS